ncbi:protein MAM3 [Aspergillus lentulus]|uniref:Protein MAM3 n=1 Tax=Aspergillus lentulus TaxID=293939 RepID=A0AAN4TAG1_ASPLE|nr:protein MAM3 [Aspergillus lentulus]KAF4155237.1 hypothetical protein CNMCM6069_008267 [Aspergillus lentulus]KAF4165374.1 hypothetical protein CNMCM6936_007890 [Aspergillus lentulus]KAF4177386.1 hypothetical protein CNMCM8060_005611 [Aspergillus lentulus]KAF4185283.1 hypothetical protein CNMCM7927_006956 [Aspergillus lentulus]KAF4197224.1 hypothetical protein CNMCM8694_003168 [Aspergillus lentulus]
MAIPSASRYVALRPVVLGLAKLFLLASTQIPLISAAPTVASRNHYQVLGGHEFDPKPVDDPQLWLYLGVAAALVLSGGAFAGLTIALMGQDEVYLQVIKSSGDKSERRNAASVLRLLKKGKHWVLVTLLLSNVITNETLPIILDRSLGGGWPAVLGSTALIVIFGEIVPQSICVRYGLPIGAWMAPCVLVLMYIMSPVAWPVAKLLDRLLGEDHGTIYKKAGLKTLVTLHKTLGEAGEQLNSDEVTIISAVLDLKEKSVGSIMTPMEDVFTMSADTVLDESTMDLILSQGYSRIPIHAPDNPMNFVGMLLVKMLITYDPEDCKRVRDFALATLPETRPETSCLDIVNFFQEGKSHMVLVSEYPGEDRGALGVVTLEDVIEELIGEEIIDESDVFIDVHKAIRRMAPAPKSRVPKGRIVEEPPMLALESAGPLLESDGQSRMPSVDRRRSSVEAPPPRFHMRLQTSDKNSDSTDCFLTHRGTTDEIREHLKHLGPSNLASRPRQTRYQNVKIKRASGSPSRSGHTDMDSGHSTSGSQVVNNTSTGLAGGIGAGLLQSGIDARDGVHAVKLGYGTMNNRASDNGVLELAIPEAVHEQDDKPPSRTSVATSTTSSSRLEEQTRLGSGYLHKGPARSGSITEQIVDVNGIRKVVLHTTSSNTSSDDERSSNKQAKFPVRQDGQLIDLDEEQSAPATQPNGHKKKKRRRKHKSHAKTSDGRRDEEAPLLSP